MPEDPLGRGTPDGTVFGFLRAVEKRDYQVAANYLEGRQSAKEKEKLARDLEVVLNRGLRIGLDDLSKAPEGRLDDGLSVYLEKVGTATFGSEKLDIMLRRTTRADAPPIWLFASDTVAGVPAAADRLALPWGEALWTESFREMRILSVPLYRALNVLLGLPVVLAITWLAHRGMFTLLAMLARRYGRERGESALARVKSLLFLLILAVIVRIFASQAVTVTGRIFLESLADLFIIVTASWILVRVTKFAAGARISQLRQTAFPGKIAVVELSSWLLVFVWVIGAFFLVLHGMGIELTPAIAGLGVGGIAIAFAAQKTIENLFGTVMIIADEAIQVGDYCQAGAIEGTVESIGLRSTRIRTLERTVVSIPNGQLAGMNIGNVARRDKFLFRQNIRLRYDTTAGQLRQVLSGIRGMMIEHPALEPSSIRVRLIRFGDFALELETFAYVLHREYERFLEVQEGLLLRIMDIIEASGTAVALPYQSLPGAAGSAVHAGNRDNAEGGKSER